MIRAAFAASLYELLPSVTIMSTPFSFAIWSTSSYGVWLFTPIFFPHTLLPSFSSSLLTASVRASKLVDATR